MATYKTEDENGCAVKFENGKAYAKFPGEREYEIPIKSNIATLASMHGDIITKEEYENYTDRAAI